MYLRLYAWSGACESVGIGGMQCLYVWEVAVVCECVGIGGMQWLLWRMEVTAVCECENSRWDAMPVKYGSAWVGVSV